MNLDPLSFALSEISYTVNNLNKKNYKQSVAAINHVSINSSLLTGNVLYCNATV